MCKRKYYTKGLIAFALHTIKMKFFSEQPTSALNKFDLLCFIFYHPQSEPFQLDQEKHYLKLCKTFQAVINLVIFLLRVLDRY